MTQEVSAEKAGQSVTGTCADNAGNSVSDTVEDINIDTKAPTLTGVADPGGQRSRVEQQ